MIFEIYAKNGKTITINSDIAPCSDLGTGEVEGVSEDFSGYMLAADKPFGEDGIFWWDFVNDCEFEFEERKTTQEEINAKYKTVCDWKLKDSYSTSCGNFFGFVRGQSLENSAFKYCPYCGKEIKKVEL